MTIRRMRAAGPLQTAGRGRRSNRRRTRLGLPRALTGPPDKGIRADLFVSSPPPLPARHLPEHAEWWARSRPVALFRNRKEARSRIDGSCPFPDIRPREIKTPTTPDFPEWAALCGYISDAPDLPSRGCEPMAGCGRGRVIARLASGSVRTSSPATSRVGIIRCGCIAAWDTAHR